MFRGEARHAIDDKGRLIIPSRFRNALGERCIVTVGLDKCLWVYPMAEWEAFEDRLRRLEPTKPDARALVRFFMANATECPFDQQGRILIPTALREHANIDRDVVVIGLITRLEIWNEQSWAEYSANLSPEAAAEKLADLGI